MKIKNNNDGLWRLAVRTIFNDGCCFLMSHVELLVLDMEDFQSKTV